MESLRLEVAKRFGKDKQSIGFKLPSVTLDPYFILFDLNKNNLDRQGKNLLPVDIDQTSGAGHYQIIGSYQALKMLSSDPLQSTHQAWAQAWALMGETVGTSANPLELIFSIFSAGGGTGAGMSPTLGFAQLAAYDRKTVQPDLPVEAGRKPAEGPSSNSVVFLGVAVLPRIETQDYNEVENLNAGRLFIRLFQENSEAENHLLSKLALPWNGLIFVSNNAMLGDDSAEKLPREAAQAMSNVYVATQVYGIMSAIERQVDKSQDRIDVNDLKHMTSGLNVIGFSTTEVPEKPEKSILIKLMAQCLSAPRIVEHKNNELSLIGLSVLPTMEYRDFEPGKAADITFFNSNCRVSFAVGHPKDYKLTGEVITEFKRALKTAFPNGDDGRKNVFYHTTDGQIRLTLFIGGRALTVIPEIRNQAMVYIQHAFSKQDREGTIKADPAIGRKLNEMLALARKAERSRSDWDKAKEELLLLLASKENPGAGRTDGYDDPQRCKAEFEAQKKLWKNYNPKVTPAEVDSLLLTSDAVLNFVESIWKGYLQPEKPDRPPPD